jgi:hypothetical protein
MRKFRKMDAYKIVADNLKEKGIIPFSARQYTIDNITGIINKYEKSDDKYFPLHQEQVIREWVLVTKQLIKQYDESREAITFE